MRKNIFLCSLIGLLLFASCDQPKEEKVEFSLSNDSPVLLDDKTVEVYVDWEPSDHSIEFDSFTFTCETTIDNTISFDKESGARPMPVEITFSNNITEDISGSLSFTYEDLTGKKEGNASVDFTINSPYIVTEDEFNHAISLEGIEFLQIEERRENGKTSIFEFSPTIYHMRSESTTVEKFIVKEGDTYNKYHRSLSDEKWTFSPNKGEDEFMLPTNIGRENPKVLLTAFGTEFNKNIKYDNTKGIYYVKESESYIPDIEIIFKNKKIISFLYSLPEEGSVTLLYSYEEKTPELPVVD